MNSVNGWEYCQAVEYSGCDREVYQQDVVIHRSEGTAYEATESGLKVWHIYVGDLCLANYGDIRFTDEFENEFSYYLWPDFTSESARVSVRLDGADKYGSVTVWYGNPSAESESDVIARAYSASPPTAIAFFEECSPDSQPVAAFLATPRAGVYPLVVNFADVSSGIPATRTWDFGDGSPVSTERHPTHTYVSQGLYTVTLTVENEYGTDTTVVNDCIDVGPPIEASFGATLTTGICPISITFTDESVGNPTEWLWDFGDGNTSTEQNPTYVYRIGGTYTVTLTARSKYDEDAIARTDYISVASKPVARIKTTKRLGMAPFRVEFTDDSIASPTSRMWDFDNGFISGEQNPVAVYTEPGTYTVTLVASNEHGSGIAEVEIYIVDSGEFAMAGRSRTAVPHLIPSTVKQVSAGLGQGLVLDVEGKVHVVHWNNVVDLDIFDGHPMKYVYAGDGTFAAIDDDGKVHTWGNQSTQHPPPENLVATRVACGNGFWVAIDEDGDLHAWGDDTYGQVSDMPVGFKAVDVAAGYYHAAAMGFFGNVVAWGLDDDGRCDIPHGIGVSSVTCGWYSTTLIFKQDGRVYTLGLPSLNIPENISAVVAAMECYDLVIIDVNGVLYNYGPNTHGALDGIGDISGAISASIALHNSFFIIGPEEPTASFSASGASGNVPLSVEFIDTSTGLLDSWLWDFGDGNTSTEQNPTHDYVEPGVYTVTLTAANILGEDTVIEVDCVKVWPCGPFYVETYEDLCRIGTNDRGWTLTEHYIQVADIDCPPGSIFPMIGGDDIYSAQDFSGIYDGSGHSIQGLTISGNNLPIYYVGMFRCIHEGRVENVTIRDATVIAGNSRMVGILAGAMYRCSIANCNISGEVVGNEWVGGISGIVGIGDVSECCVDVAITGVYHVGGAIGEANALCADRCSIHANISAAQGYSRNCFGCFVGYMDCCYEIARIGVTGSINGGNYIGGFAGVADDISVNDCWADVELQIERGDVSCGGFVGQAVDTFIKNCYSIGKLQVSGGSEPLDSLPRCGGFVGWARQDVVSNCFWDTDASGINKDDSGAIGKTTAEMMSIETYKGWSIATSDTLFNEIWCIAPGEGYPYLVMGIDETSLQVYDVELIDSWVKMTEGKDVKIHHAVVEYMGRSAIADEDGTCKILLKEDVPIGTLIPVTIRAPGCVTINRIIEFTGNGDGIALRMWPMLSYGRHTLSGR